MKIVYIHGATATHNSFAFIQQNIDSDIVNIDYPKELPAEKNLENILKTIKKECEDEFHIIAHSLGGIYSLYVHDKFKKQVKSVISLATPFNGSESAVLGRLTYPKYQVFRDVTSHSNFITNATKIKVKTPWLQVVPTEGNVPWLDKPNDGIVTKRSMTSRSDVEYVEISTTHHEVVMTRRTVNIIKNRLSQFDSAAKESIST